MLYKKDTLSFMEFIELVQNDENLKVVTVTYDIGEIKMYLIINDVFVIPINETSLQFRGSNGIDLLIHSDSILEIMSEGYDELIDWNIYRINFVNKMVLYISIKNLDKIRRKRNEI